MPQGNWLMTMSWLGLLAAHWRVTPDVLEDRIPPGLTLDTFDGDAWISIFPFEMDNVLTRGLTWSPWSPRFPELNVRTYVTADGDKPGVWFFSLDAASRVAVTGARTLFHLPYFRAKMSARRDGASIIYKSRRTHSGAPPAEFSATYEPTGPGEYATPGSLDHWLMERYCLYANRSGTILRSDIHHRPWELRPVQAEIDVNTMFEAHNLAISDAPTQMHYAEDIDVLAWAPELVESSDG